MLDATTAGNGYDLWVERDGSNTVTVNPGTGDNIDGANHLMH